MRWHSICVGSNREYFKKLIDMQLIFSKTLVRIFGIMLLSMAFSFNRANAQYFEWYNSYTGTSFSITGGLGFTQLYGDFADPDIAQLPQGLQFNLGLSYRLTNYISVRGEGTLYRLYLERPLERPFLPRAPNLSTIGWNGNILLVHDFVSRTQIDRGQKRWNAYVLGGAGITYFIPQDADTGDNLRDLSPFREYALIAGTYTFGGGIEFFPVSYFSVGLEAQYVATTTDLIDDLRPLVDTNTADDSYMFIGAKVSYQIGGAGKGGSVSGYNYQSYLKKSRKRAKYK